jgi:hypothetical protein
MFTWGLERSKAAAYMRMESTPFPRFSAWCNGLTALRCWVAALAVRRKGTIDLVKAGILTQYKSTERKEDGKIDGPYSEIARRA